MDFIQDNIKPLLATIKSAHQLIPLLTGLAGKEIVTRVKPDESGVDYYSREIGVSRFKLQGQTNCNGNSYSDLLISSLSPGYSGISLSSNQINITDNGLHFLFFKPSFSSNSQRPTIGIGLNSGAFLQEFEGSSYIRSGSGANESSDMIVHPLSQGITTIQMIRRAAAGTVNLDSTKSSLFIFHIVEKVL